MTMFSPLARGYKSWTGPAYDPYNENIDEEHFPQIEPECHRHGVTVGHLPRSATSLSMKSLTPYPPGSRTDRSVCSSAKYDTSQVHIPKTYLTRKGALMLFTAPEDDDTDEQGFENISRREHKVKNLIDTSLKLGTLDRLALSILQYGDEEFDKENASISDEKEKMVLKFLHNTEGERNFDSKSRPGSDLKSYLRDLKYRSSFRGSVSGNTNIPRSRETLELQAILRGLQNDQWPIVYNPDGSDRSSEFTRPPSQQSARTNISMGTRSSTPRSILSTSKLRESLKSYGSYLGRPHSADEATIRPPPICMVHMPNRPQSPNIEIMSGSPTRQYMKMPTSSMTGSIVEEEERVYDDALTGIDGSTVAFTESTELDRHMYTLDLPSGDRIFHSSDSHSGDGVSSKDPHGGGCKGVSHHYDGSDFHQGDSVDMGGGHISNVDVEGSDGEDVEVLYVASGGGHQVSSVKVVGDHDSNEISDALKSRQNLSKTVEEVKSNEITCKSSVYTESVCSFQSDQNLQTSSRGDYFDVETSTTVSEDMVDPMGINRVDIKTHVTGTIIEEEHDVGVDKTYEGDGHMEDSTALAEDVRMIDASVVFEKEGDWAKNVEAASHKEVEVAQLDEKGDSSRDTDMNINKVESAHTREGTSPLLSQYKAQQNVASTSPVESRPTSQSPSHPFSPSHPISPSQRPSSVRSQRRQSVRSAKSRGTPTPPSSARAYTSPTPIGLVKADPSSSSPRKSEVGSRPSSQYSKRSQTPDSAVGKVPALEVVITTKSPQHTVINQQQADFMVDHVPQEKVRPINQVAANLAPRSSPILEQKTPSPSPTPVGKKTDLSKQDSRKSPTQKLKTPSPRPQGSLPRDTGKKSPVETLKSKSSKVVPENNMVKGGVGEMIESGTEGGNTTVLDGGTTLVQGGMVDDDDDVASVASSLLREQDIVLPKDDEDDEPQMESSEVSQVDPGIGQRPVSVQEQPVKVPPKPETAKILSPEMGVRSKSPSSSKLEERVEEPKDPPTLVERTPASKMDLPEIPDYLKPKPQKTKEKGKKQLTKKRPTVKSVKKDPSKAISVASVQPENEQQIVEQQYTLYEHKNIPKEKEKTVLPDFVSEALALDDSVSKGVLDKQMQQMATAVEETVTISELALNSEGLTAEEMELAKKILKEKVAEATEKLDEIQNPEAKLKETEEAEAAAVKVKGKKKGKKGVTMPAEPTEKEIIQLQKNMQQQKKEEERKLIEEKIREKQEIMLDQERVAHNRELEVQLEIERLRQQELEMQQADEEVRKYLEESKRKQRDDMKARKKENLERKKRMAKEKFEAEKKKREEESKKALAELDRIHDEEIRKQKRLEEELKREEEERLAEEQAEEEEKERIRQEEEHERRLMEILQEEEEKALQRLADERDDAARQRRMLEENREKILQEEERIRQEILAEQQQLEEAIRKREEEEEQKREEERQRYLELKRLEEEARLQMQKEMNQRREAALERRSVNLERKDHMSKLKQSQGVTRPWVFTYCMRWPLESYNTPIGGYPDPKQQRRGKAPVRPKTASS